MKVTRKLTITADEFFDYLEDQLLKIANDNLVDQEEAYTNSDIQEGFTIVQNGDTEINKIELFIDRYQRGKVYSATAKSLTDSYALTFEVEPTEDGILVDYEQTNLNNFEHEKKGFFAKFGEALYLSRMSNALYDMQRAILKSKGV